MTRRFHQAWNLLKIANTAWMLTFFTLIALALAFRALIWFVDGR